MKAICQRVEHAALFEGGREVSRINQGFLVYAAFSADDDENSVHRALDKIAGLRIFDDENDKLNLSLKDVGGEILFVSNFTLYGDCSRGFRPSFIKSAGFEAASKLYEYSLGYLKSKGIPVKQGVFGGDMTIESAADGPVNIIVDGEYL